MTYSEEVNIVMPTSGEITLAIRADTLDVAAVATAKLAATVAYDSTNFVIKETSDDKVVSDVTPSSMTFKTVNGTSSSLSLNQVAISATKSAVIGSKGIEAMTFELKSDNDSTDLFVDELQIKGSVVSDSINVSNAYITAMYLYNGTTLLDTVSASNLSS